MEDLRIVEIPGGCTFDVRVTPRSSRECVSGVVQGALKMKVTAPPVEGEANEAVRSFLADLLGCPRSAVRVLRGAASRLKKVRVDGIAVSKVRGRLRQYMQGGS